MLEAKNPNLNKSSSSPILIAFKPRQVLLAEAKLKMTAKATEKKVLLHHAILCYLEQNTFSTTLKRFLSEAQIENDDWKASSLDLEDIFCKHLDACHSDANLKTSKELGAESGVDGTCRKDGISDLATTEEVTKKKKKKRSNPSDSDAVIEPSKDIDKKLPESAKNSGEVLADSTITESEAKPKDKKKKKKRKDLDTSDQTQQVQSDVLNKPVDVSANKVDTNELSKNTKDKRKDKKKKDKSRADSSVDVVDPADTVNADPRTEEVQPSPDATKKEKKSSKKRKRLASDEKEDQSTKVEKVEETKRRKTEGSEEVNNENQPNNNGNIDGHPELYAGEKSDSRKTTKKQLNGSAEPKTINAFQRVKIDDVEFADDKLQDNSYWAKGGAEVGYGAKAQEVLGQVRGRDFRHEKTKKKRGSYRGGIIDLQSHSVKFNYSDEE